MIKPDNHRSIAVAQRIGMSPVRADTLLGSPVDVHAISRDEWNIPPAPVARAECRVNCETLGVGPATKGIASAWLRFPRIAGQWA
jgi:hypothetical protein